MFVYSVIINIVMECLNKRGVTGLLSIFTSPVIFLMNTMIIMTTMSVAYFFRKRIFVYSVVSVIWMIIAIVNFMVLCSRKTPFTAMDIYLISDAIKVIPLYINVFEMILIAAGVILVIVGLVALWRKAKEYKPSVSTHGHLPWKGDKPPFIVAGPNAVSGRIIHGGRLIDHAPTILRLLGLEPIGMDGHPVDALVRP